MSAQVKLDNVSFGHAQVDSTDSVGTSSLTAYLAYVVPLALLLYSLFSPTNVSLPISRRMMHTLTP